MSYTNTTKKHYYAEHCPYGSRTISDANTLFTFDTKALRDAWVADDDSMNPKKCELTAKEARRIYGIR